MHNRINKNNDRVSVVGGGIAGAMVGGTIAHLIYTSMVNKLILGHDQYKKVLRGMAFFSKVSFYGRGFLPYFASLVPSRAILMYSYYRANNYFRRFDEWSESSRQFMSSGVAGIAVSVVLCPVDFVRTKNQLSPHGWRPTGNYLKRINSYYTSYPSFCAEIIPLVMSMIAGSNYLKQQFPSSYHKNIPVSFFCTFAATVASQALTVPISNLRINKVAIYEGVSPNTFTVCKQMLKTRGLSGFYGGLFARATCQGVQTAFTMAGVEAAYKFFEAKP